MEMEEKNKKIQDPQASSDQTKNDTDALDNPAQNARDEHEDDFENNEGEVQSTGVDQEHLDKEDKQNETKNESLDNNKSGINGNQSNNQQSQDSNMGLEESQDSEKDISGETDKVVNQQIDKIDKSAKTKSKKDKPAREQKPEKKKTELEDQIPLAEEKGSASSKETPKEEEHLKDQVNTSDDKQNAEVSVENTSIQPQKGEVGELDEKAHEPNEGHHHDHEHEDEEESTLDYSNYSKKQMVQVLESMLKDDDFDQINKILKEIKPAFDDLYHSEKEEAYQKYLEEGGEKDGFEYKNDELDDRFNKAYGTLRHRRNEYFNSIESQREQNLEKKMEVLETLRKIVDAEETTASINELKKIQHAWKSIGPVAPQHLKSLWANYNALIDRYYDNRSIYFELKELDRKKNLDLKLELCEKAESLAEEENIKEAVKQLNELHEEFKYIGPVPQEDQENVWIRFKAASDQVYTRRKDYYDNLREQLKLNLVAKQALVDKVQSFAEFNTDRISEWNQKTKEILEIQKEWEVIGGLPKDKAKKINKAFWSSFKTFFNHKGNFFKQLEDLRKENLDKKRELLEKAESLKESEDFESTSEQLKELQKQWKDIGPVPEKYKDEVYKKFKEACDLFFNRRRAHMGKVEEKI